MNSDRTATSTAGAVMAPSLRDDESSASAVSWAAVFAGAAAAASLSLILVVLGTGLGFSAISPWATHGASDTAMGVSTIVWISFMAAVASGTGGYLSGRLRRRWASVHTDEVYFRDTAHGFLAWAIATMATAALLTSAIGSLLGTGVEVAGRTTGAVGGAAVETAKAGVVGAARSSSDEPGALGYFTDMMFRSTAPTPAAAASSGTPTREAASSTAEVGRILARSLTAGSLDPADAKYVAGLVAQRTGASPQDAEKRVTDTFANAQAAAKDAESKTRDAADKARKAAAYTSLWLFFALLLGAFTASYAATVGGRRRDL